MITAGTAAAALLLILSGCGIPVEPTPTSTAPTAPVSPPDPAAPSSPPVIGETDGPHYPEQPPATTAPTTPPRDYTPTPVTAECSALVTPQAMYDYNPNYSLQTEFTPAGNVALIAANQGTVCGWVNQTSGTTIQVAVGHFSVADLAHIREHLSSIGSAEHGPGEAAYFVPLGGSGNVFRGEYWIIAQSPTFHEMADAEPLLAAVAGALG